MDLESPVSDEDDTGGRSAAGQPVAAAPPESAELLLLPIGLLGWDADGPRVTRLMFTCPPIGRVPGREPWPEWARRGASKQARLLVLHPVLLEALHATGESSIFCLPV